MTNKIKYMTNPVEVCRQADKLRENNSFKEAITNYLNSILLDRNNPKTYYGLGVCYKHIKNYTKAIHYLEKSAQLDENYDAYYELGICNLLKGIPCGAIKNFVQAVKINPENPDAILQLGISHELCEEYDMALMIFQKIIENSPEYLKAYEHKSALLMKMNRYGDAADILKQMLKINAKDYKIFVGIGICLDKLGRKTDAQRYYRKFLLNNQDSPQANFVKERMNKIRQTMHNKVSLSIV